MGVKRKRHVKKIKTKEDRIAEQKAKELRELGKTLKLVSECKNELKLQKKRIKNRPEPIAKRKPLGYDSIDAGMRQEMAKKKHQSKERRLADKRAAEEAKEEDEEVDFQKVLDPSFFSQE
eukprot:GEMP01030409.1.p1 GENE.GEMP01030409.1~~GEMP01030409.1.p1  ORF type:complete len:120 (+),score=41.40 GEMP01030409.1:100-459(+)